MGKSESNCASVILVSTKLHSQKAYPKSEDLMREEYKSNLKEGKFAKKANSALYFFFRSSVNLILD
jgi:hypothetical protein